VPDSFSLGYRLRVWFILFVLPCLGLWVGWRELVHLWDAQERRTISRKLTTDINLFADKLRTETYVEDRLAAMGPDLGLPPGPDWKPYLPTPGSPSPFARKDFSARFRQVFRNQ